MTVPEPPLHQPRRIAPDEPAGVGAAEVAAASPQLPAPPPPQVVGPPPGWSPPPLPGTTGWIAVGSPGNPFPVQPAPSAPARPRWPWLVGIGVVLLVAAGAITWWLQRPDLGSRLDVGPASSAPVTPESKLTSGGGIGTPLTLTGPDGTASLTVTAVTWGGAGELAPATGTSHLVIDVEAAGKSGSVAIGGTFATFAAADGTRHGPAFGPSVKTPLRSTELVPGSTVTGQIGFSVPLGAGTLTLLSPEGAVLGTVEVPAP